MPGETPTPLRHIDYSGRATHQNYTAKGGNERKFDLVPRQRAAHANKLRGELMAAQQEEKRRRLTEELAGYEEDLGIDLEIRGAPDHELKLESLDAPKFGVVLKNVRVIETPRPEGGSTRTMIATVFVRHGKLTYLIKRIDDYASNAQRDHKKLIANIDSIGLAAVEAFWTSKHPLPDLDIETWWEVWVRAGSSAQQRGHNEEAFLAAAERYEMGRKSGKLILPEHTVFLLKTSRRKLAGAISLLNLVSELRHPAVTPAFFVEESPADQQQWVDDLKRRIVLPSASAPAVCILDAGVNRGHPLLEDLLDEADLDTVRADWGKDDHHKSGHGTAMSGLAAYGDLTPLLETKNSVPLTHCLESVKILPRFGANEPEHYGAVTQEGMARAEINAPDRQRVFAMAVTATDAKEYKENGKPSAWSSALDSYASGFLEDNDQKRLICVSAGNVLLPHRDQFPNLNEVTSIEDPAQSWNALAVGAFTDKDVVTDENGGLLPDWTTIAPRGGLCPESTTSCLWTGNESRHWPVKPDLVMEGGNLAADGSGFPSAFDSLSLLTTHADFRQRLLTTFNGTSGAAALAARMAARIQAAYPQFWPETTRALMVHSAEWTNEMLSGAVLRRKEDVAHILRRFGFGVPNADRALASARSRTTLICQDSLQPFEKDSRPEHHGIVTRDMMLYRLPWPKELLQAHGEAEVRLRVTLSYFIEPNPGSRIVNSKYRYAGCNLRFLVQTPTEKRKNFIARVSDAVSKEDQAAYEKPHDTTDGWLIGDDLRRRGSLHADTWTGSAAKLAQMEHLIVFPVNGWWKLRPQHKSYTRRIRYSLVLTLESLGAEIDLYTPIQNAVSVPVAV